MPDIEISAMTNCSEDSFVTKNFVWNYTRILRSLEMELTFGGLLVKNPTSYFNYYYLLLSVFYNEWMMIINNSNDVLKFFLHERSNDNLVENKNILEGLAKQYYQNITNFEFLLSTLWLSGFSCFSEAENSLLKECSWKGIKIPCGLIFSKSITDNGICCSFNKAKADEIFVKSNYAKIIQELQQVDKIRSETYGDVPGWYNTQQDTKVKPGENMGLNLIIDSHSDYLEDLSVESDFQSLDLLIGPTDEFPFLRNKGFPIISGHQNYVVLSAVRIDVDESIRKLDPLSRKCLFRDETHWLKIGLHKKYSQGNCFFECSVLYAQKSMDKRNNSECTPWYFPFLDENHRVCDPWEAQEFFSLFQSTNLETECSDCLPDCEHTLYKQKTTTEPLQNCNENNFGVSNLCLHDNTTMSFNYWGKQALDDLDVKTCEKNPNEINSTFPGLDFKIKSLHYNI